MFKIISSTSVFNRLNELVVYSSWTLYMTCFVHNDAFFQEKSKIIISHEQIA